ncbi:MAG: UDP-N-acetylmuramoyl-L-alanine--D-glutamate ligase [Syntrophothermus sp.]
MMDEMLKMMQNRKILILGFGREGKSTYALLRKNFPAKVLFIADANENIASAAEIKEDDFVHLKTGPGYLQNLEEFDLIIKTPGISLKDIDTRSLKITSQTDLFLQPFRDQSIGITGTKGKSTTTTLIHHIFQYAERKSVLLGNMGRPAFDHLEEIDTETNVVYEMSSHQLEHISTSPHVAVLLNYFQEHLDAYSSYRDYRLAKWNIAKFQEPGDIFIVNDDDPLIREHLQVCRSAGLVFSFSMDHEVPRGCFIRDGKIVFRNENEEVLFDLKKKRKLEGEHNIRNIMAAILVCRLKGIDPVLIAEAVAGFRGLEHRLEDCGIHGGIHFYNDSIATIPEACIAAVKALGEVDTLILGGFDRGIDYADLALFLEKSNIRNLIFTGKAGRRIRDLMHTGGDRRIVMISQFDAFIDVVKEVTPPGKICLLSPAAASYDEFPNFEIRGKRFKELIDSL